MSDIDITMRDALAAFEAIQVLLSESDAQLELDVEYSRIAKSYLFAANEVAKNQILNLRKTLGII